MKYLLYFLLLSTGCFISCKSSKVATNTPFKDDISIYRIKLDVTDTISEAYTDEQEISKNDTLEYTPIDPEKDLNYDIDQASLLIAQRNQRVIEEKGILGYTIQVYSGSNRQIAEEIRDKLLLTYKEPTKRVHDPPNYKVKIGAFLSKIEAHSLYILIKEDFPQAFVVPELLKFNMEQYILDDE